MDENSVKKCKCSNNIECKECDESGKCISCNNDLGYYKLEKDTLYRHGVSIIEELSNKPLTIDILREYLYNNEIEGIVFWLTDPTGSYPICKIKRSDFGFKWPVKDI